MAFGASDTGDALRVITCSRLPPSPHPPPRYAGRAQQNHIRYPCQENLRSLDGWYSNSPSAYLCSRSRGTILQNASKNDDYASISDADALLLVAGDPASEEEPMRKGTCFQVRTIYLGHTRVHANES